MDKNKQKLLKKIRDNVAQELLSDDKFRTGADNLWNDIVKKIESGSSEGIEQTLQIYGVAKDRKEKKVTMQFSDFPPTTSQKREMLYLAGQSIATHKKMPLFIPLALYLVTEAWSSKNIEMRPSEDPDRSEVVMVSGWAIDGRDMSRMGTIIRDKSTNKILKLDDIYIDGENIRTETGNTSLSFTNYLLPAFANGYFEALSEEQLKACLDTALNSEEGTDVNGNITEWDTNKFLKEMFGNSPA